MCNGWRLSSIEAPALGTATYVSECILGLPTSITNPQGRADVLGVARITYGFRSAKNFIAAINHCCARLPLPADA